MSSPACRRGAPVWTWVVWAVIVVASVGVWIGVGITMSQENTGDTQSTAVLSHKRVLDSRIGRALTSGVWNIDESDINNYSGGVIEPAGLPDETRRQFQMTVLDGVIRGTMLDVTAVALSGDLLTPEERIAAILEESEEISAGGSQESPQFDALIANDQRVYMFAELNSNFLIDDNVPDTLLMHPISFKDNQVEPGTPIVATLEPDRSLTVSIPGDLNNPACPGEICDPIMLRYLPSS